MPVVDAVPAHDAVTARRELRFIRRLAFGLVAVGAAGTVVAIEWRGRAAPSGPLVSESLGATFARTPARVLVVNSLRVGGAGRLAGLRVGDEVRAVDGWRPGSIAALDRRLASRERVDVAVRRGADAIDVIVATGGATHGRENPADRGR